MPNIAVTKTNFPCEGA